MIHTINSFSVVDEAEVDVFLELPSFLCDPVNDTGHVYMWLPVSQFLSPSPPPCVHMPILYICVSISALEIGSSGPLF